MSSTLASENVPFLPPEIYLAIAQHVQSTDLSNYRLASKTLADAGRPELFHTIILRTTLASWSAFKHIQENEQLSKLVRTLVWDVNAWRIGTNVRDWHEWTRHCKSRAGHYALGNADPAQAALYTELAGSRQLWEAYLSRLVEEKAISKEIAADIMNREATPAWLKLPNLQTVHVVKGAYSLNNRHVCRLHEHATLPISSPLGAWRGDSLSSSLSAHMFSAIGSVAAVSSIIKWRFDGFTAQEFSWASWTTMVPGTYDKVSALASVKIRFGTSYRRRSPIIPSHYRYFHQFLARWSNLESLTLDLHNRIPHGTNRTICIETIQDTFGVEGKSAAITSSLENALTWSKLRKLSLGYFASTPRALLSLVTRHSSTLRDLRLHAIWLGGMDERNDEPLTQYSWQEIFRSIGAATNLENVTLSGLFCNKNRMDDDWDFDIAELGERVAAWIIKGEQRSHREELLLISRSHRRSHDRLMESTGSCDSAVER